MPPATRSSTRRNVLTDVLAAAEPARVLLLYHCDLRTQLRLACTCRTMCSWCTQYSEDPDRGVTVADVEAGIQSAVLRFACGWRPTGEPIPKVHPAEGRSCDGKYFQHELPGEAWRFPWSQLAASRLHVVSLAPGSYTLNQPLCLISTELRNMTCIQSSSGDRSEPKQRVVITSVAPLCAIVAGSTFRQDSALNLLPKPLTENSVSIVGIDIVAENSSYGRNALSFHGPCASLRLDRCKVRGLLDVGSETQHGQTAKSSASLYDCTLVDGGWGPFMLTNANLDMLRCTVLGVGSAVFDGGNLTMTGSSIAREDDPDDEYRDTLEDPDVLLQLLTEDPSDSHRPVAVLRDCHFVNSRLGVYNSDGYGVLQMERMRWQDVEVRTENEMPDHWE